MSHDYKDVRFLLPTGETWVKLLEAEEAEKAAEDRGFNNGVTFWKNFSGALADLRRPTINADVQIGVDMARYKPIIPTMINMDWAPGGRAPKEFKREEECHFEVPPTSPDYQHKRTEIFNLSRKYKEFTLTGQELRDLMTGCSRDGRAAEQREPSSDSVRGAIEANNTRWEAKLKRALDEQADELLSKKAKESWAAYADGLKDADKQYVGKVDEAYARGLKQGHNEATFQSKMRALRARDMLHMVMGLLRGDQPIAKGFLTSAIETLERM